MNNQTNFLAMAMIAVALLAMSGTASAGTAESETEVMLTANAYISMRQQAAQFGMCWGKSSYGAEASGGSIHIGATYTVRGSTPYTAPKSDSAAWPLTGVSIEDSGDGFTVEGQIASTTAYARATWIPGVEERERDRTASMLCRSHQNYPTELDLRILDDENTFIGLTNYSPLANDLFGWGKSEVPAETCVLSQASIVDRCDFE